MKICKIIRTFPALALIGGAAGCSSAPTCSSKDTVAIVTGLIREAVENALPAKEYEFPSDGVRLELIRTNEQADRRVSCTAQMTRKMTRTSLPMPPGRPVEYMQAVFEGPITTELIYTAEKTDDGELYVRIKNFRVFPY